MMKIIYRQIFDRIKIIKINNNAFDKKNTYKIYKVNILSV